MTAELRSVSSGAALPPGYSIREAAPADLGILLGQRERIFRDVGFDDASAAAAVTLSATYFARALADGSYKGWLVVDEAGAVVAGGGIALAPCAPSPRNPSELRP